MTPGIADRYRSVVDRVAEAAARAGRSPAEVTLVVAAKTFPAERVRAVVEAGAIDVGENYVQEAAAKAAVLPAGVRWHMIGRLQRNKAKRAAALFDCIHSLDSVELARELDRAAGPSGRRIRCLVEVGFGEATKGGVTADRVADFLGEVGALAGLSIDGLMAIPPAAESPQHARRFFAALRELRDRLQSLRLPGVVLKELSMGMSADFEAAVEEGATMIRVGTAIFGPRRKRG